MSRPSSSKLLSLQRNSPKNISDPIKSLPSLVLYCLLSIFQSPCTLFIQYHSVYPVFHMSMLKPTMSNTFSERIQLAFALVIIDRKPEYKISQIVDSKINHQWACKILYKVIWLGYEDTGDKLEWIPATELTYAADLVSDFYIIYPAKPIPLLLS